MSNSNNSLNPHIIEYLNKQISNIRNRPGSDIKTTAVFKKAIQSLSLYPLPVFSGKECEILSGFGPSLVKKIDDLLKTTPHPIYPSGPPTPLKLIYSSRNNNSNSSTKSPKKSTGSKKTTTSTSTTSTTSSTDTTSTPTKKTRKKKDKSTTTTTSLPILPPSPKLIINNSDFNFDTYDDEGNAGAGGIMDYGDTSFNFDFGSFNQLQQPQQQNNNYNNDNDDDDDDEVIILSPVKPSNRNNIHKSPLKSTSYHHNKITTPLKSSGNKFNDSIIFSPSPFKHQQQQQQQQQQQHSSSGTPLSSSKKRKYTMPSPLFSPFKYSGGINSPLFSPSKSKSKSPFKKVRVDSNKQQQQTTTSTFSTITTKSTPIKHKKKQTPITNNQQGTKFTLSPSPIYKSYDNDEDDDDKITDTEDEKEEEQDNNFSNLSIRLSFTEEDLAKVNIGPSIINKPITTSTTTTTTTSATTNTSGTKKRKPIKFKDIKCIIDNREVKSVIERDYICKKLIERGRINAEVKKLELGDFIWVGIDSDDNEWLLNYIVERKRVDDLSASIMDGRYKEQKFRLKKSGCKNIIYLVEGVISNTTSSSSSQSSHSSQSQRWGSVNFNLSPDALATALVSTQVYENITIKETTSVDNSIDYIILMTNYFKDKLIKNYKLDQDISGFLFDGYSNISTSLDSFNQMNVKSKGLKLVDFFAIQLLQITGLSVDKVYSITRKYQTPLSLYNTLKSIPNKEDAKSHFKDFTFGKNKRKFGQDLSERIYNLFINKKYDD